MIRTARTRRSLAGLLPVAVVGVGAALSCSTPSKGALILSVSTDLQTPKDIDVIALYVTTDGAAKFDYLGRVLPDGTVSLPATLAIVEPDNPAAQVRVRAVAFKVQPDGSASAQVVRDVLTTVPHQRTALLRMPLNFLDLGSAQGTLPAAMVPDSRTGTVGDGLKSCPEMDSSFSCHHGEAPASPPRKGVAFRGPHPSGARLHRA